MARWSIQNFYKKSAEEVQNWYKEDKEFQKVETYRWGRWECESDIMPVVDLDNQGGWSSDNFDQEEYEWEFIELIDGCFIDWNFIGCYGDNDFDEKEEERIKDLWDNNSYEGLENDGWTNDDTEYWLYGPLLLKNEDTGEEFHGKDR